MLTLLALAVLTCAPAATLRLPGPAPQNSATACEPGWQHVFGERPGTDWKVFAQAVFDDGNGPALYVAGGFQRVGGLEVKYIARWDGLRWSRLPGGDLDNFVHALAVFDDGNGSALYAAGDFSMAGGQPANRIAKWDGSAWSPLGSGLDERARSLAVFDAGAGPELYVGGFFGAAGGVPSPGLARWNGASWSTVGGMNGNVGALVVFDEGSGSALIAGGGFTSAGGLPVGRIARWDGASWSALGAGLDGLVHALAVHDDGGGSALYVGGEFASAGGAPAANLARWSGASWAAVGGGTGGRVNALTSVDLGAGAELFVGGDFLATGGLAASRVASFDGAAWSDLASGMSGHSGGATAVRTLVAFDAGAGLELYAGGEFLDAGGNKALRIARWNGAQWRALGNGLGGPGTVDPSVSVYDMTLFDDGSGPALHVAGSFTTAAGEFIGGVAKWTGTGWVPAGQGPSAVRALAVFDDGGGERLYAGGNFTSAGGVPAQNLARWDGAAWSGLPSSPDGLIYDLALHDDGGGPALYVAGSFNSVGALPAGKIARWDGANWSTVGSVPTSWIPFALLSHDDGQGPGLYVAGWVGFAGETGFNIGKWDGTSWVSMGGGFDDTPHAIAFYDDGTGEKLYATGRFTSSGGVPANRIARRDGASWSALGSGLSGSWGDALAVFDAGAGPELYVGGPFWQAGGLDAPYLARWNGAAWSDVEGGTSDRVWALRVLDSGAGTALHVGGGFTSSPGSDSYIAAFHGCSTPVGTPYCFGAESCPCGNAGGAGEGCAHSLGFGGSISAVGSARVSTGDLGILATGLLPGQAAMLFAGRSAVAGGAGAIFGDGLRCASVGIVRLGVRFPTGTGTASWGPGLAAASGFVAGETGYFQVWYRDPVGSPCGSGFNLSHGLEVDFD